MISEISVLRDVFCVFMLIISILVFCFFCVSLLSVCVCEGVCMCEYVLVFVSLFVCFGVYFF